MMNTENIFDAIQSERKLNLFEKIQAVSIEVRNIEKNMTVGSGSYSYKAVQDIDVVLAVKDAETKFKLISIPVKQDLVKSEIVKTINSKSIEVINYVDIIKTTVRIIDLENAESFIEVEAFGRGLDSGDKGFGKASTYARKYALLNAYKIATGEDPDAEKSKEATPVPEDGIRNEVVNYMLKDTKYLNNILGYFNIGSIDEMNKSQIKIAHDQLKNKKLI